MSAGETKPGRKALGAAIMGAGCLYALGQLGPVSYGGHINAPAALAALGAGLSAVALLSSGFKLLADVFVTIGARRPKGLKGTAGFVKSLRQIRRDLVKRGWGPYWGAFKGQEVIADYASNALTLGPAGTGKGVGCIQPTILSIRASKLVIDFKGELACVLARRLRRRGEIVRIVNLGDLWPERLGQSDCYNPLHIIADCFWRSGGLSDVSDDLHELGLQLYPEPAGDKSKDDNRYFRDGSRNLITFAILICLLVYGYEATLAHVAELLNDRESLLRHAQWAAGRLETSGDGDGEPGGMPLHQSPWADRHDAPAIDVFAGYLRGVASGVADLLEANDSRTVDSFITGAQQALARFNVTTRAHKVTSSSTFRFADMKEGKRPVTVFLVADASRIEAQAAVLGLLQWCAFQELKRHENKHIPAFLIGDEATNFKIAGLDTLLTWGRGYGLRLHLVIQSFAAFERVYGKETLKTLLSETEIKQFLAGQREPETLKIIEAMLAEASHIVKGHRGTREKGFFGVDGYDYREEGRSLMTADEIRRTDKTILFIRANKPMLVDLPPIAAIRPWRRQIGINPFHGKKFLRPVKLDVRRRDGSAPVRLIKALWRLARRAAR